MPLLFDHASPSDYLNSYLREYVLGNFYAREVKLDLIRGNLTRDSVEESALGYVLTDDKNLLGKWEDEAALEHWGCKFSRFIICQKQKTYSDFVLTLIR
jgi:hypothetical protein